MPRRKLVEAVLALAASAITGYAMLTLGNACLKALFAGEGAGYVLLFLSGLAYAAFLLLAGISVVMVAAVIDGILDKD